MLLQLKGGINTMCNVSLGIRERALAEGIEKGKLETYLELIRDGVVTLSEAAKRLQVSEEKVKELLEI